MIVAGIDEAGYGPKLGPLVVGLAAFEVDPAPGDDLDGRADPPCLWTRLAPAVRREAKGDPASVWVADSKQIKPKKDGVRQLELGVLAFLAAAQGQAAGRARDGAPDVGSSGAGPADGPCPRDLAALLARLGEAPEAAASPWYGDLAASPVPTRAYTGEVAARAERLRAAGARGGVRPLGARVCVFDAPAFNARVTAADNKAAVLAQAFVALARDLRARTEGPLELVVDRQGGRTTYARLLGQAFPNAPIETDLETPEVSRYRARTRRGLVRATFRVEAEQASLPVALASMTCKYVREVLMDRLNAWFCARVDGLAPTAGYATDANRFLAEVGPQLGRLGVRAGDLVRCR